MTPHLIIVEVILTEILIDTLEKFKGQQ